MNYTTTISNLLLEAHRQGGSPSPVKLQNVGIAADAKVATLEGWVDSRDAEIATLQDQLATIRAGLRKIPQDNDFGNCTCCGVFMMQKRWEHDASCVFAIPR